MIKIMLRSQTTKINNYNFLKILNRCNEDSRITQNRPSPSRRGTDLNFSSRQGEVYQTYVNSFLLKPLISFAISK
ncbi:hypothetical protein FD723_09180 [Nostoc sp. C052]|nr:hypothetical protein FD723_09180 [Nostoc sp. C052]